MVRNSLEPIKIQINFLEKGQNVWQCFALEPDAYFDEDDAPFSWDSVPRYNHAVDYLDNPSASLQATKLVIEVAEVHKVLITETFWNNGRNRLIERIDEDNGVCEREVIIKLLQSDDPETWEIIRCHQTNGFFNINYHGLIATNSDGTESEKKLPKS